MVSKLSPKSWESPPPKKALSEVCIAGSAPTYSRTVFPRAFLFQVQEKGYPWVSAWVGQAEGWKLSTMGAPDLSMN